MKEAIKSGKTNSNYFRFFNPYQLLEVNEKATPQEIQAAFEKKSKELADIGDLPIEQKKVAQELSTKLSNVKDALLNPTKRELVDHEITLYEKNFNDFFIKPGKEGIKNLQNCPNEDLFIFKWMPDMTVSTLDYNYTRYARAIQPPEKFPDPAQRALAEEAFKILTSKYEESKKILEEREQERAKNGQRKDQTNQQTNTQNTAIPNSPTEKLAPEKAKELIKEGKTWENHFKNYTPYELLGLDQNCIDTQIASAARKFSLHLHPDKFADDKTLTTAQKEAATELFKKAQQAKEDLTDPFKRSQIDQKIASKNNNTKAAQNSQSYSNAQQTPNPGQSQQARNDTRYKKNGPNSQSYSNTQQTPNPGQSQQARNDKQHNKNDYSFKSSGPNKSTNEQSSNNKSKFDFAEEVRNSKKQFNDILDYILQNMRAVPNSAEERPDITKIKIDSNKNVFDKNIKVSYFDQLDNKIETVFQPNQKLKLPVTENHTITISNKDNKLLIEAPLGVKCSVEIRQDNKLIKSYEITPEGKIIDHMKGKNLGLTELAIPDFEIKAAKESVKHENPLRKAIQQELKQENIANVSHISDKGRANSGLPAQQKENDKGLKK